MIEDKFAILLGVIASIILTPIVVSLWHKRFPPRRARKTRLSEHSWRRSNSIHVESMVAAGAAVLALGVKVGFAQRLDFALSCILLGSIVLVPAIWAMLRTSLIGYQARSQFLLFIEEKHGVSAISWLVVSGVGLLLALYGLMHLLSS